MIMERRDTERRHAWAERVWHEIHAGDIQGILHDGTEFRTGIEAFSGKPEEDLPQGFHPRPAFDFCRALGIPFHTVVVEQQPRRYHIGEWSAGQYAAEEPRVEYGKPGMDREQFIHWWRNRQPSGQTKPMYEAGKRLHDIDHDLFNSGLAWGVNVDGFILGRHSRRPLAILEKRVGSASKGNQVESYDPNEYFHGTQNRAGDFHAWSRLWELCNSTGAKLILMTFENTDRPITGIAEITDVRREGLTYRDSIRPCDCHFTNDLGGIKDRLRHILRPL